MQMRTPHGAAVNRAMLEEQEKAQDTRTLGGLTGYGSGSKVALRVEQEARRAKAQEWAEKRRALICFGRTGCAAFS